ncbi:Hsp20/alpha crystallin family protein [Thiohalorhabdus sp. Cl-TMA]|uniref:Hsp20/alpha crystallin family protein n=1 Tax=Thiohalorhabdus methylotrophus TaxID=3242694 RepID=A0ABV4TS67_9GAMM
MAEGQQQGQQEVQRVPSRGMTPFDEMERMFEELMPRGWMRPFRGGWPRLGEMEAFEGRWPRVDVQDQESEILVRAELPGVKKDDLDVSLSEHTVTIKATSRREEEEGEREGEYYRREISTGAFSRTVALPSEVDSDNAKAKFEDGILELTLPKREQAKRRHITVE